MQGFQKDPLEKYLSLRQIFHEHNNNFSVMSKQMKTDYLEKTALETLYY